MMDDSFWRQVERARKMTGDERVREGLALFDRAIRIMTDGIRHQFPGASEEEVRQIRRERLAKIRQLQPPKPEELMARLSAQARRHDR